MTYITYVKASTQHMSKICQKKWHKICQAQSIKCGEFFSEKRTKESLPQDPLSCYSFPVTDTTTTTAITNAAAYTHFPKKRIFEDGERLLTRRLAELVEMKRSTKFYEMPELGKSIDMLMLILADKISEVMSDIDKDMGDLVDLELEDSVELRQQLDTVGAYALDLLSDAI
jgi:hypothetical protein